MEDITSLFNYRDPRSLMADRYASQYQQLSGTPQEMIIQNAANAGSLLGNALFGGKTSAMAEQAVLNEAIKESEAAEDPDERLKLFAASLRRRGLEGYAQKAEMQLLNRQKATAEIRANDALAQQRAREAATKTSAFGQQLIDAGLKPGSTEYQAKMNQYINKELAPKESLASQIASGLMPFFKKESEGYGTFLADNFKEVSTAAKNASRILPSIETNLNILNKGFETGFGTETKAAAASVLGALGVQGAADYASNSQMFNAAASGAILQKQLEQKGPQTEADALRIQQTSAQLGNTTEANKFILKVAKAQAKRDIEQRTFFQNWRKNSKNKTFEGAEDAWYAGEGGRSLFDRPELQEYRFGSTVGGSGVPGDSPATSSQKTLVRTGKLKNGRKVNQYSDGSVEYAD